LPHILRASVIFSASWVDSSDSSESSSIPGW
jgi:hypothetical protein